MRYSFFFVLIGWSISALSQQQQQLSNVFLSNVSNPSIQMVQTNLLNVNDDSNEVNQMSQQGNFEENNNDISDEGLSNVRKANSGKNFDFNVSFKMSSQSSLSSSSKSKMQRHTFSKKLKKFERNFYGKIGVHKKKQTHG